MNRLRLLGGHYHQNPNPSCLGMTYLTDMQEALNDAFAGTAETRPFELNWRGMDTYYIHGSASIVTSSEALNANR